MNSQPEVQRMKVFFANLKLLVVILCHYVMLKMHLLC